MSRTPWYAALIALAAALPAVAQEALHIGDAVDAALARHSSVLDAEAAARSAALALRVAEIDQGGLAISVSATPAASVDLAPLEAGTFADLGDTFDLDAAATVSAALALPWGMEIAGSYTGEVDLDRSGRDNEDLIDVHGVSVVQDLLPEGRLSEEALAVHDRRDQLRLARLRLQRVRNEVALQVARAFLTLTERTETLALLEERLAFAERDLARTTLRVAQGAADRLALLDATIAVTDQRNGIDEQRAALALDTAEFFADLGLAPAPLAVPAAGPAADPAAGPAALRRSARALLTEPTPSAAIAGALDVLEAQAALSSAELQAERTLRGALPAVSLGLDYRKARGASRPGSVSVSITGSYTLFDSGRNAAASAQARERVATLRRALATARGTLEERFARARLTLASAVADEELAALRLERANLRMDQATRRHAAGAISDRELEETALQLREAEGNARAAMLTLGDAYLSLAIDLGQDVQTELAAIAR
ncbi:MAG: TolC family protein [Spirochaetaceae bacterium]|nr:TolC family protein [Spirochaetaceae bacterium]